MWNDFVEAFGKKFEDKPMFAKANLFVSELKTWVEWNDGVAKLRMYLASLIAFLIGIVVALIAT